MTKLEFVLALHEKLAPLPLEETEERLNFYTEMIEDRIEEGLSEEQAVAAVGSVEEIASQIAREIPVSKAKEKTKIKPLEIVLLVLGSPIWVSLALAAFAVVFSVYASLWAVIISFWAVFASFVGTAFGGIFFSLWFLLKGNTLTAAAIFSAVLILSGLSIFTFFGCKTATKGIILLTKKIFKKVKKEGVKNEKH